MDYSSASVRVERQIYDLDGLHHALEYEKPKKHVCSDFKCSSCKPGKFLLNSLPILSWLPQYQWKQDLVNDLVSGFTVAIMHIPQGMAYALLGNVPPIVGIYMAFFPVIVYFFLGTSKHNSMGTFAIICLMTGKVVLEKSQEQTNSLANFRSNLTDTGEPVIMHTPIEIAAAVTFIVAICQLIMYVFRLGILSTLLSETLVNGFTTGAAFHVLVSQIKDLFGLHIPRHKGAFTIVNTLVSIFREITNLNVTATVISAITITVCVVNNEFLKPHVSKISSFPIPIELLVVVTGTLVSNHWNFSDVYSVNIIGDIPSGIPAPTLPHLSLLSSVAVDGIIIAIVAYTIALSMGLIFAQKLGYEVDANQELLAQGAGNLVGSFFSCMPFSASLSRSLIQQTVGGKTQLASLVSCFLLLFVLLWIGPFFEPLPKSVLASVIVVALKGMLMQVTSLRRFWTLSKLDGTVWILTFLTTVFINVDVGLLIGLIVSILTVMILGMKPYTCLLGSVPSTDLYVDITRYKKATELPNVKIFHYCGGINFATKNYFKSELYRLVDVDPQKELVRRMKVLKKSKAALEGVENVAFADIPYQIEEKITSQTRQLTSIIIDFSALSYIDPSSVNTIKIIAENYQKINIPVLIAGCSGPVYEMMQKCELIKNVDLLRIFPTVHDAVLCTLPNVDITSL